MMTEKEMRKLDAWIAKHVMGWRRVNFAIVSKDSFCVMGDDDSVYIYACSNSISQYVPTTDPAAAMSVLEKCVDVQFLTLFKVGTMFVVAIADEPNKPSGRKLVQSDSLPLAICLFAKKLYETKT